MENSHLTSFDSKGRLNKEMKNRFGVLIHFYREEIYAKTKNNLYSQSEFIKTTTEIPFCDLEVGSPVCSRCTYSKLENGGHVHDIEIYEFFMKKIHQEFDYLLNIDDQTETFINRVFDAVEAYDVNKLVKCREEIMQFYKSYTNYFYIKEIYECLLLVINYNLTNEFPSKEMIDKYYKLNQILDPKLRVLICDILYIYYYSNEVNYSKVSVIAKTLEIYCFPISTYPLSSYYVMKRRFIFALELIEQTIQHYSKKNNYFRLGECYSRKALILNNIETREAIPNYLKAIEYLEKYEHILANSRLSSIYFNMGFHYYLQGINYQLALDNFMKYIRKTKNIRIVLIFYVLDSMIELNRNDLEKVMSDISYKVDQNDLVDRLFVPYFEMRIRSNNYNQFQSYIVEKIFPFFEMYEEAPLLEFFRKELTRCVKHTKRYSDLVLLTKISKSRHELKSSL